MSFKSVSNSAGLLLLATVLGGCAMQPDQITTGAVRSDYRTTHPIVLSQQEQVLDVPIATDARELNIATKSNIRGFAAAFANSGTGSIFLMLPSGSPNVHAVDVVRGDILRAIVDGGAQPNRIVTQRYDASAHGPAAPVRLSYQAVTASAGPCGQWPEDLVANTEQNENYQDFGCSLQSNLAAMIANPLDLLGPRQMSPIDATERAAVIQDYQKGPRGGASEVSY